MPIFKDYYNGDYNYELDVAKTKPFMELKRDNSAIICFANVQINISKDGDVSITGHKSLEINIPETVNIKAENINMYANTALRMESGKHLIQKSDRIDLNPDETELRYRKYKRSYDNTNK